MAVWPYAAPDHVQRRRPASWTAARPGFQTPGTTEDFTAVRCSVCRRCSPYTGKPQKSAGPHIPYPQSLLGEGRRQRARAALEEDARFFHPAYLRSVRLARLDFMAAEIDWDEVAELLDASYRLAAPAKLIRQLDN